MSSRRQKGNQAERRLQDMLAESGWTVHRAIQTGFRAFKKIGRKTKVLWLSRTNDVFGEFDIVAARLGSKVKWIQVTHGARAAKRASAAKVPLDLEHNDIEVWEWRPGRRRRKRVGRGMTLAQVWVRHVLQIRDGLQIWVAPVVVDPLVCIPSDISESRPARRSAKDPARRIAPIHTPTPPTEQLELLAAA